MKNTAGSHSSSLFLLELVVAILIFALASAISLQFFARAHILNKDARLIDFFSNECSAAAELTGIAVSSLSLTESLLQLYPHAILTKNDIALYYDSNLVPCEKEGSCYLYTISLSQKNSLLTSQMEVWDLRQNTVVYELESKRNLGGFVP